MWIFASILVREDYLPSSSYVTFTGDGLMERARQVTVSVLDDMTIEGDQTFTVSLANTSESIEFTITDTNSK